MKIVAISDTHNQHQTDFISKQIPDCDVLIHAGDFTSEGTGGEVEYFLKWFAGIPNAKHKIFIAGNHDFFVQKKPYEFKRLIPPNLIYLENKGVEIDGIKFYGTPWTPFFYDWAFNGVESKPGVGTAYKGGPGVNVTPDRDHPSLLEVYSHIPDDTNVLICHGPPRIGVIDLTLQGDQVGSIELLSRAREIGDLILISGHIHEGYGMHYDEVYNNKYYNVSTLNRRYIPANKPVEIEI